MYGIASVSKMLATVATMKLVDQGLVSLDAPFAHYVPSFTMLSPGYRDVTVRMLLDHSSGFPGSAYGDANTSVYYPGYLQEVMDTLAQSRLKYTPGFMSVYCNDGFTMIEALVPAVTGKSYAAVRAGRDPHAARHDPHRLPAHDLRRRHVREGLRR